MSTVVIFRIDELRLALRVESVQRVIWAVEITAIPGMSQEMLGIINVEGVVIPVVNFRHLLQMPQREIELEDLILIFQNGDSSAACVVDSVEGIQHYKDEQLTPVNCEIDTFAESLLRIDDEILTVVSPQKLITSSHQLMLIKKSSGVAV